MDPVVTEEMKKSFMEDGFLLLPELLSPSDLVRGRELMALATKNEPVRKSFFGKQFFPAAGGHIPFMNFCEEVGIHTVADQLIRPDLTLSRPARNMPQLVITDRRTEITPMPHIDGLNAGTGLLFSFSLLAGVWLTDFTEENHGNLCVWPGSHLVLGEYIAEHGIDALSAFGPGVSYPQGVRIGDFQQITGTAGTVILAHHMLAHASGPYLVDTGRRETMYYRLETEGHKDRLNQILTQPLLEFQA